VSNALRFVGVCGCVSVSMCTIEMGYPEVSQLFFKLHEVIVAIYDCYFTKSK